MLNSPEVLRWNTDKRYLETLRIPTVATRILEPGAHFELPDEPFVVKPAVGVGSIGAARYAAGDERARRHVTELHEAGRTVMVQPYVEAVDTEGEVELMYLNGVFSHAVRKGSMLAAGAEPGSGLYLEETIAGLEPSPAELELGEQALDALPFARDELLYARVDLLPGPLVLEVELTEPSFFIGYAEGAAERFADAIVASAA